MLEDIQNTIKDFRKTEFFEFKSFLKLSSSGSREKLDYLSDYILTNFSSNNNETLTINKIVKDCNKKFNFKSDIYEYLDLFCDQLNDFIFLKRHESNDINKNLFLLNQHINLKNYKMYSKVDRKLKTTLFEEPQDHHLNYSKYLYSNEVLNKRFKEGKKKNIEEGEFKISSHIFNFLFLSKYYFCEIVTIFTKYIRDENNFNISTLSSEIPKIKSIIENIYSKLDEDSLADDLVNLYYYQYLCFSSPGISTNYQRYKSFLQKIESNLSDAELKLHYSNLLNYCLLIDNVNKESEYNTKELLEFFKIFIIRKYYADENNLKYLPPAYFRNIAILCERVKDINFLGEMISRFSPELDPKIRKDFVSYANVFFYNLNNDFLSSIKYSFKVPNSYTGFLIDTKRMNVINYYSLSKFDNAEKEIHALRELIRRQKVISGNVRKRFFTFCKYSERLILNSDKINSISYSRSKLVKENWFPSKNWLLDKYSELMEMN